VDTLSDPRRLFATTAGLSYSTVGNAPVSRVETKESLKTGKNIQAILKKNGIRNPDRNNCVKSLPSQFSIHLRSDPWHFCAPRKHFLLDDAPHDTTIEKT
jgi:hypothetical protein